MSGPWEDYATSDGGARPWEDYSKTTTEPTYKRPELRTGLTIPKNVMSPPGSVDETIDMVKEVGSAVGNTALKSALPLAGGIAGTVMGGMTSPVTGPAGPIAGEMLGSAGGEYLNQLIGITEKDNQQVMLAGGAPLIGRLLSSMARGGAAMALRTFGGRQNVADAAAEIMERRLAPPTPSEELYDLAGQVGAYIPTPKAAQTVQDILSGNANIPTDVAKQIKDSIGSFANILPNHSSFTPTIPGQDIAKIIKDLRFEASTAYKAGNARLGHAINSLRGSLLDDTIDAGVPEFVAAGHAARREIGIDKLTGILHQANPVSQFEKAMSSKSDRLFKGTFNASEIADIKKVLNKMSTVTPSGGSGVVGRAILAGAGSTISSNPITSIAGAATGAFIPEVAAKLLATSWGRRAIEQNLLGKPLDNATMAKIATVMRGDYADSGNIKEAVHSILKSDKIPHANKVRAAMIGAQGGGVGPLLSEMQ